MSTIIPNTFTSYELSEKEELQGSILTGLQIQVLQNALSATAEEKLALEFDPEHPQLFIQQEAYKKGQIELYTFLIDKSLTSAEEMVNPTPTT